MDQAGLLVAVVVPGAHPIELQVAAQPGNLQVIVPGLGLLAVVQVALVPDDHPAGFGARFQQQSGLLQSSPVGGVGGDGAAGAPAGHGRAQVNRFLAGPHQSAGSNLDGSRPNRGVPLAPPAVRIFHPLGDLLHEEVGHSFGAVGLDSQTYRPGMLGRQGLAPESGGGDDMDPGPPGQVHHQLRIATHPDGSAFHDGSGAVFGRKRLVKGIQHPRGLSQHSFPQRAQGRCRSRVKLGPIHRGRMFVHEGRAQAFGGYRTEHRPHGGGPVRSLGRGARPKLQGRPGCRGRPGQELPPAEVSLIREWLQSCPIPAFAPLVAVRPRAALCEPGCLHYSPAGR